MTGSLRRLASSTVLATLALLTLACGGASPPVAKTAGSYRVAATPAAAAAAAPQAPTSSNVSISDEIRSKCGMSDADAYFPFDSARLTSSDRTPLDQVATCFTRGPLAGHTLKLVGHADPRGSSDYNLTLGESRADAVASYLGARGMAQGKAQPTSRGALDATGTDESGWQRDRRVDVLLGN